MEESADAERSGVDVNAREAMVSDLKWERVPEDHESNRDPEMRGASFKVSICWRCERRERRK